MPSFWGRETEFVMQALESTWISGGPFVDRLEAEISRYCDVPYCIAVSNGTAAIHAAYLTMGIEAGDEVIVPGFGFLAAANVAIHTGARPVFAEVDPDTWCVTAEAIDRCITKQTKLIVPIHTYGNMCDMNAIIGIAQRHGLPVLEDAAEAFGSKYEGRDAGTISTLGTFSFQATKTLTTGEGGMVVTHSDAIDRKLRLYRSHGMSRTKYWHEVPGSNFRLTNLQAALGCAQFEKLPAIVQERKRVYQQYQIHLAKVAGIVQQAFRAAVDPVVWAIAVKLDPAAFPQGRDAVIQQLQSAGIETRPGFYAPSLLEIYQCPRLPISEQIGRQVICLPSFPLLVNDQIEFICRNLAGLRR